MKAIGLLVCAAVAWPTVASGQETDLMRCTLQEVGGEFSGQCRGEGGDSPFIRLRSVDGRDPFSLQGSWGIEASRAAWTPVAVAPPSAVFQGAGVIEMFCCGWFSLIEYEKTMDRLDLTFSWDSPGPPPGDVDLRIVNRAREIMESSPWDKADDRVCGADDVGVSLYCALLNASGEEMGLPHHYQAALRIVRGAVNTNYEPRITNHSLMDFNNHQDTTLDEVRELLRLAAAAIRATIVDPTLWPPTGALYSRQPNGK